MVKGSCETNNSMSLFSTFSHRELRLFANYL